MRPVSAALCVAPGRRRVTQPCPGWGVAGLFSNRINAYPAVIRPVPLPLHTLISCLYPSIHCESLSRLSMASSLHPPPPKLSLTLPVDSQLLQDHTLGICTSTASSSLLLDVTRHGHLKLRVHETGLCTPQTCSSCRAPISARAPPSAWLCTSERKC